MYGWKTKSEMSDQASPLELVKSDLGLCYLMRHIGLLIEDNYGVNTCHAKPIYIKIILFLTSQ